MKIRQLKYKLLLGAATISIVLALAYMTAVSLVIRQQHLDQSSALLRNASRVVRDGLSERRENLLAASRELATQKDLGSTIWYLTQYSQSNLDRETLVNTYRALAQDTYKIGLVAKASRIAIYNASGNLISFALFEGNHSQAGFVDRIDEPLFQVVALKTGEDLNWKNAKNAGSVKRVSIRNDGGMPKRENAQYAVADGLLSIEVQVPIMGEAFDSSTGKPETRQLGFVDLVQPLDLDFVRQYSRLTNTKINVFTEKGLSSGSLSAYVLPDWGGSVRKTVLNEISIGGAGYYQCLMPLDDDGKPVGAIAMLQSMETVQKNIWEMIGILWLIAAASLLFIFPIAWYFATSLSHPITLLIRIFRDVASGAQGVVPSDELDRLNRGKNRHDELGDLTRSFMAMNDTVNQKISQINEMNASLEHIVEERTAALAAKEQESRTLIENSPDAIARYDRECRRIYVNPAFGEMAEGGMGALLGKKPTENPGGATAEIYERKIRGVFEGGQDAQFELKWPDRHGREVCSHIRLTAEFDSNGNVSTVLGVGRDITERMEFEETIWKQANFDALTKLPNRQMFHDRLEQEARVSHRSGKPMALLLVDLDRFKEVNDTLGHDMGDLLLVEAASRITSCIRGSDTVARLGGDEFTVILSELDDVSSVGRIAQDIIGKLAGPFRLDTEEAYVSASIGISLYPNDATELDVLFKNADQAMYVAKNAGRNRFSYFTPDLQEAAQIRLRLTSDLRAALASNQFRVHYQPIVGLKSGEIHKAEALLRWQHPEKGMIDPTGFISLAEETGLIVSIGDWVFKEAVKQAKLWRNHDPSFQISVNKSPVQIHQDEQMSWPDYLRQEGLDAKNIAIEITEGLLLNAEAEVNEKLLKFRDAGIQLALDDFGTGYSSLSYLKRFDIDYLKIDRSYVQNLEADENDLALCEAIVAMAHKLGLKVIAEGVETTAQRDLLFEAGCDFAQGYLYSKPLPPEQFESWLTGLTCPSQ